MTALGAALVGCGNIAGRYADDLVRQRHVRFVGVTDLDRDRAHAFAKAHDTHAYPSLDELLADPAVEIVVNLTSHAAHVPVTTAALEAGRHVFSEKPMTTSVDEARRLLALAEARGCRIGSAPIVAIGELAQTARRWIADGRLGEVRLAYADVNWGRIETWHPDPAGFYAVGPLFDVGIYPLTLLTALFGPVRRVTAVGRRLLPRRATTAGTEFEVRAPDVVMAVCEMEAGPIVRLTANFYVPDPARQRGVELHGDAGSLWLSNWFQFGGTLEHARYGEEHRVVPLLREPEVAMPWAAGLDEMAEAIAEGRPHRTPGDHAAHVIDTVATILRAADQGRALDVRSSFAPIAPMEWAEKLPLRD